jgi:hypothetical protein
MAPPYPGRTAPFPGTLLLALLATMGCPEPELSQGPGGAQPPGSGASGTPGGTEGSPPGGAAPPAGARPQDAKWSPEPGMAVELAGQVSYTGSATGPLRIDFLRKTEGQPPELVHSLELTAAGPWTASAPQGAGAVHLVAYIDKAGDGPSADDPAGRTSEPVVIDTNTLTGLDLVVSDTPDLGDLTPGAPEGAGGPPQAGGPGGAPPKGQDGPPGAAPAPSGSAGAPGGQAPPPAGQ